MYPENSTVVGFDPSLGPDAMRLALERISELAIRQQAAIIQRDVRALDRLFESLLMLHSELGCLLSSDQAKGGVSKDALQVLAGRVREQLRLNQVLLANGVAIADRYMALLGASNTVVTSVPADEYRASAAAFFSGVA
jgi:hypothetical protein